MSAEEEAFTKLLKKMTVFSMLLTCPKVLSIVPIVNPPRSYLPVVFFSSFSEISVMAPQIQVHNGQQGVWMYQCIYCKKNFPSSQAIAGHMKGHFRDGWVKGTPQGKEFVKLSDYQRQQGSAIGSSIHKQPVSSTATNAHCLPKGDVQNFGSLAGKPSSQASSSRRPQATRHHLRIRDLKILARLEARLAGEEQQVISRILHSAMRQIKISRKKNTEMKVIPNKDSEATPATGTTNKDIDYITIEDSDDESKNM